MIAANMMDMDVQAIDMQAIGEGGDLSGVLGIFEKAAEDVLPVLQGGGRLVGVLWREDIEAFLKGSAERGEGQVGPAMAAALVRADYAAAGPMASADEIREKLASASGGGGKAGASAAFVYIVDGHGRLLGRVGQAEIELREKAYEEALS